MTEENLNKEEAKECKCFCRSEGVRKFFVVALGTFVGVYCALSLFAALHRPPMPCHMKYHRYMHPCMHHRAGFDRPKPPMPDENAPFVRDRVEIKK